MRLLLLAGTVMSAAALSFHPATVLAAGKGLQIAQVPPPPPQGEVPPEEQKKQPPRREERQERQQQRGEELQQRQEQRQERPQREERQQREERPQREERQQQRGEERQQRQEQRQERPQREAPPPAERPAPPPVERHAPPVPGDIAPPAPRGEAPRPPAERQAPPPADSRQPPIPRDIAPPPASREAPPRAEERPNREQRREDRREERRDDRRQEQPRGDGSVPPIPPVPPRGDAPPPAGGAEAPPPSRGDAPPPAETPSIAPAPPPAGEKPAIPPEELRGGQRTPEQRQRAEERVEREFKNRDRRFDERFNRRVEERGDRTIIREGDDRIIIRDGDRTIIRNDETERLRRNAEDVRTERRGRENVTVIRRPGGVEIVTVTDDDGNLIRRVRRVNGRETVLIDNRRAWEREGRWDRDRGWRDRGRDRDGLHFDFYLDLPPVRIDIPREEYIIDADEAGYDDYYEALEAPPLVATERPYSLQEVTQNVRLRERVRSIDLNTINFATAEWKVADDQVDKLEDLARAMKAVIDRDPTQVYLIEGHTDAVGSALDNLSLSDRRAEEVAAILTEYYQIPAENLVTQGYGEDYLKVNTLAANPENRRVTIRNITGLLQAEQAQAAPQ